jgi:hypothetical protein
MRVIVCERSGAVILRKRSARWIYFPFPVAGVRATHNRSSRRTAAGG